ncbi:PHP domain-containing protein [Candidatus Woesearchaeota archaeon]|nr:PHP domain-containing protein [Candidatus Woesearchaeota archaeon]
MLKADLHLHTHEDPFDFWLVKYSAKDLIRAAAKQKFQVLSITHHRRVFFNQEIKSYARKKGILLIPGAEPFIEHKDVLILNTTNEELRKLKKLNDLDKIKDSALIIAPHPFFLTGHCLENKLEQHINSFHAIEFSHFYTKVMLNPLFKFIAGNPKARLIAEKYHKPLIGTSDSHKLYELGTTYTMIDSAKTKDAVIEAVKRNKIKLVTHPMPPHLFFRRMFGAVLREGLMEQVFLKKKLQKKKRQNWSLILAQSQQ